MQYFKINIAKSGTHYRSGNTLNEIKAHLKSKNFDLKGATFTEITLAEMQAALKPMPKATLVNGKIVFI